MKKTFKLQAKCPYCGGHFTSKILQKHVSTQHKKLMQKKLQRTKPKLNKKTTSGVTENDRKLLVDPVRSKLSLVQTNKGEPESDNILESYLFNLETKVISNEGKKYITLEKINSSPKRIEAKKTNILKNTKITNCLKKFDCPTIQNLSKCFQVDPGDLIRTVFNKTNKIFSDLEYIDKNTVLSCSNEINNLIAAKGIPIKKTNDIVTPIKSTQHLIKSKKKRKKKKTKQKRKPNSIRLILIGHPKY